MRRNYGDLVEALRVAKGTALLDEDVIARCAELGVSLRKSPFGFWVSAPIDDPDHRFWGETQCAPSEARHGMINLPAHEYEALWPTPKR